MLAFLLMLITRVIYKDILCTDNPSRRALVLTFFLHETPLHSTVILVNTALLAVLLGIKVLHRYGSNDIKTLKVDVS